ncbi:unnamed protein product [Euphydryas editha]|uniref:Glycosyltransferase family 92 protein n=1 Tax=Euphydryas editha TaxID=104508 RepID=A0AAU9UVU8_EUPED|nr:unnamed protein product [Euphydryas editha]
MIEIISPSAAYYPELDDLPLTLGDSMKRVKWRSKQNLDTIYLMAYAQTRGTYYLMLEDDVIAQENYMQEIKQFVTAMSVSTPEWFILEFCHWRATSLIECAPLTNRRTLKDPRFGILPLYYPHKNPPIKFVRVTIKEKPEHTIKSAYEGKTFFWGVTPKKGEVIEFWFSKPTIISSYTFRSGNVQHQSDKFFDTVVEVYTEKDNKFIIVDQFDEFGLADGKLDYTVGPLLAIRLRVIRDSIYWAVLSEIELKTTINRKRSTLQTKKNNKKRRTVDVFSKPYPKPFKKSLM